MRFVIRGVCGLLAALVLGAAMPDPPLENPASVLEAAPISMNCIECIPCGSGYYNRSDAAPYLPFEGITDYSCSDRNCGAHEKDCGTDDLDKQELGRLWMALETFDGEDLRATLAFYDDYVSFNESRGAFQVIKCGAMIGQIIASPTQLATMAED